MVIFVFLLLKMCWNTYFIGFLKNNQNLPKNGQKNDNFFTFCNKKTPFCCNPPFDQKLVFFNLGLLKPKTLMMNKKHNLKSGKTKIRKRDRKKKKDRKPKKKRKYWSKKSCNWMFWCCSFHETKAKKKEKEKREKKKESQESKEERQEGRQEEKNKRETEKEKLKKGEAKKG